MLTPGIIFGRFQIGSDTPTRPINLIFGAGYQFAVTGNPVTANESGRNRAGGSLSNPPRTAAAIGALLTGEKMKVMPLSVLSVAVLAGVAAVVPASDLAC